MASRSLRIVQHMNTYIVFMATNSEMAVMTGRSNRDSERPVITAIRALVLFSRPRTGRTSTDFAGKRSNFTVLRILFCSQQIFSSESMECKLLLVFCLLFFVVCCLFVCSLFVSEFQLCSSGTPSYRQWHHPAAFNRRPGGVTATRRMAALGIVILSMRFLSIVAWSML